MSIKIPNYSKIYGKGFIQYVFPGLGSVSFEKDPESRKLQISDQQDDLLGIKVREMFIHRGVGGSDQDVEAAFSNHQNSEVEIDSVAKRIVEICVNM